MALLRVRIMRWNSVVRAGMLAGSLCVACHRPPRASQPSEAELLPVLMADILDHQLARGEALEVILDSLDLRRNLGFGTAALQDLRSRLDGRVSLGAASDSTRCRLSAAHACRYGRALSVDWLPHSVLIKFSWTTLPLPACGGSSEGYYWDLASAKRKLYPGIRPIHGDCVPISPRPLAPDDSIASALSSEPR